jgi:hypothetical protein
MQSWELPMPADHPEAYWQAVARGLEAESEKAAVYVTHGGSLGVAREVIFANLLKNETPGPYRVRTGLIRGKVGKNILTSRQCDVLVYNPNDNTPHYAIEEFVVVPADCARVVVEVKSTLNKKHFKHAIDVWNSTRQFNIPALCFAYQGIGFKEFVTYMSEVIKADAFNSLPCFAVHGSNYLAVRAPQCTGIMKQPYLVLNFREFGEKGLGMATAYFLQWYAQTLDNERPRAEKVWNWFNRVDLPKDAKVKIAPNGTVNYGNV